MVIFNASHVGFFSLKIFIDHEHNANRFNSFLLKIHQHTAYFPKFRHTYMHLPNYLRKLIDHKHE